MAISTYIIELRVEFADEEKYDHILEMTRQAARDLYTAATLLKDKREPQISLETGDMFQTNKDLTILSEEDAGGNEQGG